MGPAHVVNVVDEAVGPRCARRGVAHVTIPKDIQELDRLRRASARTANVPGHTRRPMRGRRAPLPAAGRSCRRAADLHQRRQKGRDPGRPRRPGRRDEVLSSWPRSSAGRSSSRCSGKARRARRQPVHDRRHRPARHRARRRTRWRSATRCSSSARSFPYIEFYPKPGQAQGVQIDLDPARIGLRYPVDVGLVRRLPARARRRCCRCSSARRTARSSKRRRSG